MGSVDGAPWTLVPAIRPAATRIFSFIVITLLATCQEAQSNSGYLVVLPSVFRPGVEEVLSVTILTPSEPIYVEAKLFSQAGQLVADSGHEIFGKGTIKLKIPRGTKGNGSLKICGNCISPREGSFTFYNSTTVHIEERGSSAFIQTDRPVYKPGQTVHINVINTGPDLQPTDEKVTIIILDARGTRVEKWDKVKPKCCGLINLTYPLSEQPSLGQWTVVTLLQGRSYNKTFDVSHYVLPKFEVSIQPPDFIQDWDRCEALFIHARYTFGKKVHGLLKVNVTLKGKGHYGFFQSKPWITQMKIHGVAAFNVCVSDLMDEASKDHFRGQLHVEAVVSTPDGTTIRASDSSCPVHRHLVELQFSKDTRRHFKPGLPFKGKVLAYYPDGSPAENVTVQINSIIDRTETQPQENVSSEDGLVEFNLPAITTARQTVWLSAKVTQLNGQDVSRHYFPTYMSIGSWFSPSRCHILVESLSSKLKPGDEAKFRVHSTCSCDFTLFYEVMGRGNLVHSGIHFARHVHKSTKTSTKIIFHREKDEYRGIDMKVCTVFIKFPVTHEMAPLSRLLAYYVRSDGEGVADSIVFNVEPTFRNRISLELSEREALPGEDMKIHIHTNPDSVVCLSAVDKSVHQLKPGYQLNPEEIFDEMETYDVTAAIPEPELTILPAAGRRRRRSASWRSEVGHNLRRSRDAQYAFEECGLKVMTDSVTLHFKQESHSNMAVGPVYYLPGAGHNQILPMSSSQKGFLNRHRSRGRERTYFPETWIWTCFNTSATRKSSHYTTRAPDSVSTWRVDALSISPKQGLALADPVQLRTFQMFFIDFTLPSAVTRDEQAKIPLTLHNYLQSCVKVHLRLHLPSGVRLVSKDPKPPALQRLCVGTMETKTLSYIMVFDNLGQQKILAEAEAFADSRCCSGIVSDDIPSMKTFTGYDMVKERVEVEAEGVTQHYTKSVFFCPSERIQLHTPSTYGFKYLAKPEKMAAFTFYVRTRHDARLALSETDSDNPHLVEIVLGSWFNSESWIAIGPEGESVVNASTKGLLSDKEFRPFWVAWKNGHIQVGTGENMTADTVLLTYDTNKSLLVGYVGFSTGWDAEGDFKIWRHTDVDDASYAEIFHISLPPAFVPGSQKATASLIGDVMGSSIHNMAQLLQLPRGCGEQNMITFAPNIFILRYLHVTKQLTEQVKQRAIYLLMKGYQRQLTYRRHDGAYSAFGQRDEEGSTWLTAFVVRSLAQATPYIYVDDEDLIRSKAWILARQQPDGSFLSKGRIINKELQGGVGGEVALTAYVTLTLIQTGIKSASEKTALLMAKEYLEGCAMDVIEPYTAALSAYALTLLNSEFAVPLLRTLNAAAIKSDGQTFWSMRLEEIQNFLLLNEGPALGKATSASIEVAGYAVLAYVARGDITSTIPIVKWLAGQQNMNGGFSSTQDTVVALHALSEFAMLTHSDDLDLTVTLASTNLDLQEELRLSVNNSDVAQTLGIPSVPTALLLTAVGSGCALFQVDVSYNVPDVEPKPAFDLHLRVGKQTAKHRAPTYRNETFFHFNSLEWDIPEEFIITIEACARWLEAPGHSNMALMEITMVTGFQPITASLNRLLEHAHLKLKRYDLEGKKLILYFDEIKSTCHTCVSFEAYRKYEVRLAHPVLVKVYDYYEPGRRAEAFLHTDSVPELTAQLCDGDPGCNQLQNENQTEPAEGAGCPSIFGCPDAFAAAGVVSCTCYRDCHHSGPRVCASDGRLYHNLCRLKVASCQQQAELSLMPLAFCEDFAELEAKLSIAEVEGQLIPNSSHASERHLANVTRWVDAASDVSRVTTTWADTESDVIATTARPGVAMVTTGQPSGSSSVVQLDVVINVQLNGSTLGEGLGPASGNVTSLNYSASGNSAAEPSPRPTGHHPDHTRSAVDPDEDTTMTWSQREGTTALPHADVSGTRNPATWFLADTDTAEDTAGVEEIQFPVNIPDSDADAVTTEQPDGKNYEAEEDFLDQLMKLQQTSPAEDGAAIDPLFEAYYDHYVYDAGPANPDSGYHVAPVSPDIDWEADLEEPTHVDNILNATGARDLEGNPEGDLVWGEDLVDNTAENPAESPAENHAENPAENPVENHAALNVETDSVSLKILPRPPTKGGWPEQEAPEGPPYAATDLLTGSPLPPDEDSSWHRHQGFASPGTPGGADSEPDVGPFQETGEVFEADATLPSLDIPDIFDDPFWSPPDSKREMYVFRRGGDDRVIPLDGAGSSSLAGDAVSPPGGAGTAQDPPPDETSQHGQADAEQFSWKARLDAGEGAEAGAGPGAGDTDPGSEDVLSNDTGFSVLSSDSSDRGADSRGQMPADAGQIPDGLGRIQKDQGQMQNDQRHIQNDQGQSDTQILMEPAKESAPEPETPNLLSHVLDSMADSAKPRMNELVNVSYSSGVHKEATTSAPDKDVGYFIAMDVLKTLDTESAGVQGTTPTKGESQEGEQPAEGESQEEEQPAEGESQEGEQPAEGESQEGEQPAEGESQEEEQPAGNESQEEVQTAEGESREEVQPDEEEQPAEGETQGEEQPAEGKSQEELQPAEGKSQEELQPAEGKSQKEVQPAEDESQEEEQPAEGEIQEEEQPAEGESQEEEQPAEGESHKEVKPIGGESQEVVKPAEGESQKEEQPAEGESQEEVQPEEGESQEEEQPAEGESQEVVKPAEGESQEVVKPAEGESQEVVQPAEGESDEMIPSAEEMGLDEIVVSDSESKDVIMLSESESEENNPFYYGESEEDKPFSFESEEDKPLSDGEHKENKPLSDGEHEENKPLSDGEIKGDIPLSHESDDMPLSVGESEEDMPLSDGEVVGDVPLQEEGKEDKPLSDGEAVGDVPLQEEGKEDKPLSDGEAVGDVPLQEESEEDMPLSDGEVVGDVPLQEESEEDMPLSDGEVVGDVPLQEESEEDMPLSDGDSDESSLLSDSALRLSDDSSVPLAA